MLSERTLRKWRMGALKEIKFINTMAIDIKEIKKKLEDQQKILKMIQELLDQHLVRR
ncbi:hypothetical protein KAU11_00275 [Candidatus Babeliales bacterium]|nr:hypothetical protein [Candidatus Babeliales bacterium]